MKKSSQLGVKQLPSAKDSCQCHKDQGSCLFQHTVTSNAWGHMTGLLTVCLWTQGSFKMKSVMNKQQKKTDTHLSSPDILQRRVTFVFNLNPRTSRAATSYDPMFTERQGLQLSLIIPIIFAVNKSVEYFI